MLRRLGIRAKVLAVLAVPMIVLLLAGGYISYGAFDKAKTAAAASEVIDVLNAYAPFGASLLSERALSLSSNRDEAALAAVRAQTDEALAALRPVTAKIDLTEFPDEVVAMFSESQNSHNFVLPATRTLVDTDGQLAVVQRNYDTIINGQIDLVGQIQESLQNRELGAYVAASESLSQTAESLGQELTQGLTIIETKGSSTSGVRSFVTQTVSTEVYRDALAIDIATLGNPDITLPTGDPSSEFTRERSVLAGGVAISVAAADPVKWSEDIQAQLTNLSTLRTALLAEAVVIGQDAQDAERATAVVTIVISLLAAALSLLFALVVSRAIVIPLKRLTAAAAEVREQLPKLVEQVAVPGEGPGLELAQIPVDSSDEIGRLAAAFNSVNSTTLLVAQEQAALRGSIAEMFINVARRDQVLLNRQLSFIDSLERSEEDPNALANLFRLDHLATRMRRNAESLLVLAGIDTGRRVRDSMPLSDVIRTASSEIEQYDRIDLDLAVDPQMLGFNALGAAHLLAELFENATIFSEPETPVEVTTGAYGAYVVVQVLDHGLGMSEAEIEAANIKIRSTSAGDALGAQRLGLFVVGRIAHRLGAEVTLAKSSQGTGTVTQVRFPITMFEATEGALYGAPSAHAPAELASGSARAEEAPLVEIIDLAQLTDGATSLGLPRRRQRSDEDGGGDATGTLPAVTGLPQRSVKTFDESKIVLPGLAEATLAPELAAEPTGWAPAIAASPSQGLPSRSRSSAPARPSIEDEEAQNTAPPAPPEARTALFSGFRTRADLPTPAPADAGLPTRREVSPGMLIPGLVPDDEPDAAADSTSAWTSPWATTEEPSVEAPHAHSVVDSYPSTPSLEPFTASDEAWSALPAWDQPSEPVAVEYPSAGYQHVDEPEARTSEHPAAVHAPVEYESPRFEPSARQSSDALAESWDAPAETWAPTPAAAPAPAAPYSEFTAFGGYSGWVAGADDTEAAPQYAPQFRSDFAPIGFGPMLDEARAWNAGELESEPVAEQSSDVPVEAAESWDQPVQQSSWQAPVWTAPAHVEPDVPATAEPDNAWLTPEVEAQWQTSTAMPAVEAETWNATPAASDEYEMTAIEERRSVTRTPTYVDSSSPTQTFNPIEAELLAEPSPAPVAPRVSEPTTPSWSATPTPMSPTAPGFSELVHGDSLSDDGKGRKRWNPFGRKKGDETPAEGSPRVERSPFAQSFQPVSEAQQASAAELRSSAWSVDSSSMALPTVPARREPVEEAPIAPLPVRSSLKASSQWAPPSEPIVGLAEPVAEGSREVSSFFRSSAVPQPAAAPAAPPAWSPPEWARGGSAPAPAASPVVPRPSAAPRVGALDDEVAAMLALRSDIQEQALSELSQLSAYRPSAVNGVSHSSLTRRVPSTIPEAPPIAAAEAGRGVDRDADQLRSRLSSFQSGSSRGRRAAVEPTDPQLGVTNHADHETLVDPDQNSNPPAPTW